MHKFLPSNILINFKLFCLLTNKNCYFPLEIKQIIYNKLIKSYSSEVIYYNLIKFNLLGYEIKYAIKYIIYNQGSMFLNNYFIKVLENISLSYIPRKYRQYFWANFLQVLSVNINRTRFYQIVNNISFKSEQGKNLKLLLNYWLILSKKFNFKLFLQTRKYSQYIRAKSILNMNNYDKYIISPIIIKPFSKNTWMDYDNALLYLNNYKNIVMQNIIL